MADTTNLGITKPTVGADTDTWGGIVNTGLDDIDAVFAAAGSGTSVGLNVGAGKTLNVAGTLTATGATGLAALAYTGTLTGGTGVVNIGSGQVYKDASGNVGIGTSAPATPIHVYNASPVLRLQDTVDGVTAAAAIQFWDSNSQMATIGYLSGSNNDFDIFQAENAAIDFYTNSTQRMRISADGSVGIGTTAFDAKLLVDSSVNFDPLLARTTPAILVRGTGTSGAGAYGGALSFSQINSSRPWGAISGVQQGADVDQGGLAFFVHGSTSTNDQTQEVMRISAAGSVGIGTISPAAKLSSDVSGASSLCALNLTNSGSGAGAGVGVAINFGLATTNLGAFGKIEVLNQTATTGSNSYMAFSTRGGDVMAERLRITAAGNVGINTSSPVANLSVRGGASNASDLATAYSLAAFNITPKSTSGYSLQFGSGPSDVPYIQMSAGGAAAGNLLIQPYGGNLLVGTTSASFAGYTFKFSVTEGSAVTPAGINNVAGGVGASNCLIFARNGTQTGSISVTGTTTSYGTSSDYRLKEDWVAVADASTRVNALKPINFAWISSGERVDGFLAHELAEVVPEAVTGTKDAVNAEGKPVYQGIDQSKLVPLLTAALQEALAKIESLEARLDAANI